MHVKPSLVMGGIAGVLSGAMSMEFSTAAATAVMTALTAKFAYKALHVDDLDNDLDFEWDFDKSNMKISTFIAPVIGRLKTGGATVIIGLAAHFGMQAWNAQPEPVAQLIMLPEPR